MTDPHAHLGLKTTAEERAADLQARASNALFERALHDDLGTLLARLAEVERQEASARKSVEFWRAAAARENECAEKAEAELFRLRDARGVVTEAKLRNAERVAAIEADDTEVISQIDRLLFGDLRAALSAVQTESAPPPEPRPSDALRGALHEVIAATEEMLGGERNVPRIPIIDRFNAALAAGKAALASLRPAEPDGDRAALVDALAKATQQEFSMALRMRAAIAEARARLAKGRFMWNGPCHECDAVLAEALTAACPVRPEHDIASRPDRDTAGEAGGDLVERLALANEVAQLVEPKLQKWLDWCEENEEAPEARSGAAVAAEVFLALTKCRDDALAAANAKVAELTEALRPFAEFAPTTKTWPDDMEITNGSRFARRQLTIADLRRAAAAIGEK